MNLRIQRPVTECLASIATHGDLRLIRNPGLSDQGQVTVGSLLTVRFTGQPGNVSVSVEYHPSYIDPIYPPSHYLRQDSSCRDVVRAGYAIGRAVFVDMYPALRERTICDVASQAWCSPQYVRPSDFSGQNTLAYLISP